MKPIVVILENAVDVTGSLKSILRSCSSLSNDFDFKFILPENSKVKYYVEKEGYEVFEIPFLELRKSARSILLYLPTLFLNVFRFRRILNKSSANLIISNDFYNMVPSLYKVFAGQLPYITYVRFIPSRFPSLLVSVWCFFHYKFATRIIAVSSSVFNALRADPKIILVYNELPVERGFSFYPYDLESKTILYLSNYIPGKGLEFGVKAFATIPEKFSNWRLRFVGGDMGLDKNKQYKQWLKNLAVQLKVDDRIDWCEFEENVTKEYIHAALVLNFSSSESFSLTCIEAMFIGRPVIATKCGGPQEIITPGFDGELVDVGDVESMGECIAKLLSDSGLRKVYGERGHQSVTTKFSLEKTAFKLKPVYLEALFYGR